MDLFQDSYYTPIREEQNFAKSGSAQGPEHLTKLMDRQIAGAACKILEPGKGNDVFLYIYYLPVYFMGSIPGMMFLNSDLL